ncbi:MAG TPA: GAF domain-containing protein, partial [Methylomirabilota bacterium]|nr:GAF domain-containing protein [Methylomirabilota bacterium]
MTTVLDVARATASSIRLSDVLSTAAAAAVELIPDSLAAIWLVAGDRLQVRGAAGVMRQSHAGLPTDLAPGEGLIGHVALARDVIVVEEPAGDPRVLGAAVLREEGVRTFVGVPLAARHGLQGVLGVLVRRAGRPDDATLHVLGALAAQTALAVESARLFARVERRRRTAEALGAVSQALAHSLDPREVAHLIADTVIGVLDARDVVVFRLEPATGELVSLAFAGTGAADLTGPIVLPPGRGLAGRAVSERRPVITRQLGADPALDHPPGMGAFLAGA